MGKRMSPTTIGADTLPARQCRHAMLRSFSGGLSQSSTRHDEQDEVVTRLSSNSSSDRLSALAVSRSSGAAASVTISRSSSLFSRIGGKEANPRLIAQLCVDGCAPATSVAVMDLSRAKEGGERKRSLKLKRFLSDLPSLSLDSKTAEVSCLVTVGHADGSVTVHAVWDEDDSSQLVAATPTSVGQSSSDLSNNDNKCVVEVAFLPISFEEEDSEDYRGEDEALFRIVVLTKRGDLCLLLFSVLAIAGKSNYFGSKSADTDENSLELARHLEKQPSLSQRNERESELIVSASVSLSSLIGSHPTGAMTCTCGSRPYIAVGMKNELVLIFRLPSIGIVANNKWIPVKSVELPSQPVSLVFSGPGPKTSEFGDASELLFAGLSDGEVAILDATCTPGLNTNEGVNPSFRPFYFIEGTEVSNKTRDHWDGFDPIRAVSCHRDWIYQGSGRLLLAIASSSTLRVFDVSTFETFYLYDFGVEINDISFAVDLSNAPRVIVATTDGITHHVGLRSWSFLFEESKFIKLHEDFQPPISMALPNVMKRSSKGILFEKEAVPAVVWGDNDQLHIASGKDILLYHTYAWDVASPQASSVVPKSTISLGVGDGSFVDLLACSADTKFVAASIGNGGSYYQIIFYIRQAGNGSEGMVRKPKVCSFDSSVTTLRFSPDSQNLLVATDINCAVFLVDDNHGIDASIGKTILKGKSFGEWSRDGKFLALADGSKVHVLDTSDFSEVATVSVSARVTSLAFDPIASLLAIAHSDNGISFAEYQAEECEWKVERVVDHDSNVNVLEFSPDLSSRYLLALSVNKKCHIYSTSSYCVVQEIEFQGVLRCASFHSSGSMIALAGDRHPKSDRFKGNITLVRVGEVLNRGWYPLLPLNKKVLSTETILNKLNDLTRTERAQILYHNSSSEVAPMLTRIQQALDAQYDQRALLGSVRCRKLPPREEIATYMQDILQEFPRAIFGSRECGVGSKSIFEMAMEKDDPRLLKAVLLCALVGCRAHSHLMMNDEMRGGHLTEVLAKVCDKYPNVAVDVIQNMVFWPVPTLDVLKTYRMKDDQPKYTVGNSPVVEEIFGENIHRAWGFLARPMIFPIPGLSSLEFLSAMITNCPAEVYQNDEIGLVLDELWVNSTRIMFLVDFAAYLLFFICWSILVTSTANQSEISEHSCPSSQIEGRATYLWAVVFVLNIAFGVRELRQLHSTSGDIRIPNLIWDVVGGATRAVVEHYRLRQWAGMKDRFQAHVKDWWNTVDLISWLMVNITLAVLVWRTSWTVEVSIITTFFLLLRLLGYLRGFDDCGWLLVVLFAQFQGAQGFMIVIGTILVGFAVCFNVLLAPYNEDFSTFGRSLFSMFDIAILGDFDPSLFKNSGNKLLAMGLFTTLLLVVLIVAMSGFVLILESAMEEVRANEDSNRRYQRARVVIDYLKLLSPLQRSRDLGKRKYFFTLVPVDHDDAVAADKSKRAFQKKRRGEISM